MKKFLAGLMIFLALLVIAFFAVPFFFKNAINEKVKDEINKNFNAKIDYTGFSLDIFRQFPNLTFSLEELSITGVDSHSKDTLAYIPKLNLTIDWVSVIGGGKYKLLALNFTRPQINAQIDSNGKANWDIRKHIATPGGQSTPLSENSNFSFEINRYKIEDGAIAYNNQKDGTLLQIRGLSFTGSGNINNDLYNLAIQGVSDELSCKTGAITYLNKVNVKAQINLEVDKKNGNYTFNDNSVCVNGLCLQLKGDVRSIADSTSMNISFESKQNELRNILSVVPSVDQKDFDKMKTAGTFTLEGTVNGIYSNNTYPSFSVNIKVDGGMFEHPRFPAPLKNISLALNITKPQGSLDSIGIDIRDFHCATGSNSDISLSGKLTNITGWRSGTGKLSGILNLKSNNLIVDEWMPKDKEAPGAPASTSQVSVPPAQAVKPLYFKVPQRLNVIVNCRVGRLHYDKLLLNNVSGTLKTEEGALVFENFSLNAFGGSAKLSGKYIAENESRPHINFAYTIDSFDIQQTSKALPATNKIAPASQYMQGSFSSAMSGSGQLASGTDLDYNSLEATGHIALNNAKVAGIPVLDEIVKTAHINSLQNLEVKYTEAEIKIKDGKVNSGPTDIKFTNGFKLNVKGFSTFNRSIDYDMRLDVPSNEFGSVAAMARSLLSGVPGLNINVPETVVLYFKVTGSFDKPDVRLSNVSTGK